MSSTKTASPPPSTKVRTTPFTPAVAGHRIIVVMWVLYANILHAFVYDDKIEVVGNRTIRFWTEWKDIVLYNLPVLFYKSHAQLSDQSVRPI